MAIKIIAEAGVNHNGELSLAKELIDCAAESGADVVKFQTFKANKLVTKEAQKAIYQKEAEQEEAETQYQMLKKLELDYETHWELKSYCDKKGIHFLSTPFDLESAHFLVNDLGMDLIKVPSGEMTNGPFLLGLARFKKEMILSTGMCGLADIENALAVVSYAFQNEKVNPKSLEDCYAEYFKQENMEKLRKQITLLHCTTEYPTPLEDVQLNAMNTLESAFQVPVGYSDHTLGVSVPVAAAAKGAQVIEKHFTLDKNLKGPDHKSSLEPQELNLMVKLIREVELCLGDQRKIATKSDLKNMTPARKSLIAKNKIKKGDAFSEENLTIKRPGDGVSPMLYWSLINKKSSKDYEVGDKIEF